MVNRIPVRREISIGVGLMVCWTPATAEAQQSAARR
jgi:hypothetical protein